MSDPLQPLLEALRAAQADPEGPTRLATVTGGSATTINVRFDGETAASSRSYPKIYAPAAVGDRVIMLRTGSTWTALGRIPQGTTTSPDTGWIALDMSASLWTNYASGYPPAGYRMMDGIVYMRGLITRTAAPANGSVIGQMQAGFRPAYRLLHFVASDSAGFTRVDVDAAGNVVWMQGGIGYVSLNGIPPFPAEQ